MCLGTPNANNPIHNQHRTGSNVLNNLILVALARTSFAPTVLILRWANIKILLSYKLCVFCIFPDQPKLLFCKL